LSSAGLPKLVFITLVMIAAWQGLNAYPMLPDRLASHFDGSGVPNGFQSKPTFFKMYAAVVLLATVFGFVVPRLLALLPNALFNLPNKDYWLAPERRAGTMRIFEAYFGWFGCAILFFAVSVLGFIIQANFHRPPRLDNIFFIILLPLFLGFIIVWTVLFVRRFRTPR
jgi:uncharacterized membrane protein